MTIDDVLEKLYEEGSFEGEHKDIHPDRIKEAKTALLEIIKGVKPKEKEVNEDPIMYSQDEDYNIGFNQGVEAYAKAIEEMFK